jgi:hypothetical protein
MNTKRTILMTALLTICGQALAHHGFAGRYDEVNLITLEGTVVELQLVNPHATLIFAVRDADGKVVRWNGLLGTATTLMRNDGWSSDTLKPGDRISVLGAPAVRGAPDMLLMHESVITLLDTGKEVRNTLGEESGQRGF